MDGGSDLLLEDGSGRLLLSPCHGNGDDHCCYYPGAPVGPGPSGPTPGVCPFLAENAKPGRRWSCSLMDELGDWAAVHADARYLATLQPLWRNAGPEMESLWLAGVRCGVWPDGIAALDNTAVTTYPALGPMRAACQAGIAAGSDRAFCCWGGQPVEP